MPETNQRNNSCENIMSKTEILNISLDSGSKMKIEEPSFAHNKNFFPKITDVCNLGKNKVNLIKDF